MEENNFENKQNQEKNVIESEGNEEEEDELSPNKAFDNVSMGETTM